jgi:hypothetical protein
MFSRAAGGKRPPGRMKGVAAGGRWLAVLAVSLLAACTHAEIEDHSLQFNQATGSLGSRLMLLNVVRAAKGYPVQFSKVASYSGQSRLDGGLNLNIPLLGPVVGNPNSVLSGSVAPSATVKSGVSQLQLADLSTAEFQKNLRTKVTANDFAYYRSQGWPKALVNTLLIEELLLEPNLRKALIRASERTCRPGGSAFEKGEYRQLCSWLLSTARRCLDENKEQRASPEGDLFYRYPNNPGVRCQHESFQWFFAAIRVLPGATLDPEPKVDTDECTRRTALLKDLAASAKDGKAKSKDAGKGSSETVSGGKVSVEVNVKVADKADKGDDGSDKGKDAGSIGISLPRGLRNLRAAKPSEIPDLADLRNEYVCLVKEGKTPIVITWRSPERMVRYLGEVLAVQNFGSGGNKVEVFSEDGRPVQLLRVESGREVAGLAAVSVEGPERDSFYIPIPDRDRTAKGDHLSLQALALVMESVNLAVSGKELPRSPTFFLSGG